MSTSQSPSKPATNSIYIWGSCWMEKAISSHASPLAYPVPPYTFTKVLRLVIWSSSGHGGQDNHLHRQHPYSGRDFRASNPTSWESVVDQKSVFTPAKQIEFLGLEVNSELMKLSLSGEKLKQVRGEAMKLFAQSLVSARTQYQFRQVKSCCPGSDPSSPVLPPPAGWPERCPCLWWLWLWECSETVSGILGRVDVVAATP